MKAIQYPKKNKVNKKSNKNSKSKKDNIKNNKSSIETIETNKIEDVIINKKYFYDIFREDGNVFISAFHSYDFNEYEEKSNIVYDNNNHLQTYDIRKIIIFFIFFYFI